MPLRLFRSRNVAGANLVMALLVIGFFGMFFLGALYMQRILGYDALEVGLAFLPSCLVMGTLSLGYAERLIMGIGPKAALIAGLVAAGAGLLLFARAPVDGTWAIDILPVMLLLGTGAGLAFPALMTLAMSGATQSDSGLASGLINTITQVGGAIGLAVLATLATERTDGLRADGVARDSALNSGYHLALPDRSRLRGGRDRGRRGRAALGARRRRGGRRRSRAGRPAAGVLRGRLARPASDASSRSTLPTARQGRTSISPPMPRGALVLGHGAGGGVAAPDLVAVAEVARAERFSVALVEQPYRVAGRRSPAPAHQLDTAWAAVVEQLQGGELRGLPLIVGGRSAGARVACRTAAESGAVAVLCLAFPLHPPGRPEKTRQAELDAVELPTLVVQGDRDQFGMPAASPAGSVVTVPGNHGLKTDLEAVAAAVRDWLRGALEAAGATTRTRPKRRGRGSAPGRQLPGRP